MQVFAVYLIVLIVAILYHNVFGVQGKLADMIAKTHLKKRTKEILAC